MSLSQSLSISLDSMKNNQLALAVVSHNIANMNTKGYARERANFSEDRFYTNATDTGARIRALNGANLTSVSSFIDNAKFNGLTNSYSDAKYYNTLVDGLNDLENVANDLGDDGLNALLNNFFAASVSLEQYPADLSIRQQYITALEGVCDKFNYISSRYKSIQEETFSDVQVATSNINSLLSEMATLNFAHVKNGQSGSTQNDINAVLAELSNYADLSYDQNTNGSYNIYYGGVAVVRGSEQLYKFTADFDETSDTPLTISLESTQDDSKYVDIGSTINSGSLKGQIDFLNGSAASLGYMTVNDMKAAINDAQTAFMNALNAVQTYENPDENVYAAYITTKDGELVLADAFVEGEGGEETHIPAKPPELLYIDENGKLQINSQVKQNPYYIAAARIDLDDYAPGEDWTKSIGNSTNAGFMTAIKDEKICSYGSPNDSTLSQFLINTAAKNGMDLAAMENKAELYQGIADANEEEYSNAIGVNLDEELADMIKYQRAYEASAAIFSAANNMMQIIMGLV